MNSLVTIVCTLTALYLGVKLGYDAGSEAGFDKGSEWATHQMEAEAIWEGKATMDSNFTLIWNK
tara:strand:- start:1290 stop:1481 length:192 start_codon:yes stop_codon:yes gene_type:complete